MAYPSSLDALRTDLTGANDAAAVDHAGLHNAVDAAVMAVQAELGLDPSGAAATVAARLAAIEADSRWTNARTPTAHKASHATGGSDVLSPADIGAATSEQGAKADSAVQSTLVDAKGDLLVGAADNVLMRLPAAADGRLLTTDGSQAAGVRWALPTTLVDTGSPLGVVVPDFNGQMYVDVSRTFGARKWVATSTTAASWVVVDGDTGWMSFASALQNGWAAYNSARVAVRRFGASVSIIMELNAAAATADLIWSLPSGWRPTWQHNVPVYDAAAATSSASINIIGTGAVTWRGTRASARNAHGVWHTSDPWPTAAPV